MGWPLAIVLAVVVFGVFVVIVTVVAANMSIAAEKAKGENGEQYRLIAADYETLAKETRDVTTAIQADLATLREKVDSVEKMMRDVG